MSVYEGKKGVYFSVKNDCEPLSAEELAQVFESFYRADSSRSSEGTGLGLSIAKNIIELHGGKMTAKSSGGIAEFGFSLWETAAVINRKKKTFRNIPKGLFSGYEPLVFSANIFYASRPRKSCIRSVCR